MGQASAEQGMTGSRQLRREGNPFRLRLTSQSPPYSTCMDPPGIHP
jgi:hypothetical protein